MQTKIPPIIPNTHTSFRNVRLIAPYKRVMNCRVRDDEAGMDISDFLMHRFPFRTRQDWESRLMSGLVIQGKNQLQPGDRLLHHPPLQFLTPAFYEPSVPDEAVILKKTKEYALVYKPAPMPVHPGGRYNKNTLTAILGEKLVDPANANAPGNFGSTGLRSDNSNAYQPGSGCINDPSGSANTRDQHFDQVSRASSENLRILHRLDAVTSGLMLFGRCPSFSKKIQKAFADGRIQKYYLAVVYGCPIDDNVIIDKPVRRKTGFVFETAAQGKASVTGIEVLLRGEKSSLVKCIPRTGRTHQIRLHLREWGHPIIDDPVYGFTGQRDSKSDPGFLNPNQLPNFTQSAGIPAQGTKIPAQGTGISAQGTKIPDQVTEIPAESTEFPTETAEHPIQNTGISLLHYRLTSLDPPFDGNLFDYFENPGIPAELLVP